MKLHILSDLYSEFADFVPLPTEADVIVLAGDIGVWLCGIEWPARLLRAGSQHSLEPAGRISLRKVAVMIEF